VKMYGSVFVVAGIIVSSLSLPAYSSDPDYGQLLTINPSGGTDTDDGLKIDVASTQLQVTRDGATQLYGVLNPPLPDPNFTTAMYNYFSVTFDENGTNQVLDSYWENYSWVSGTSAASLSDDGKSGNIVNTLTSEPILGSDGRVELEVTFSYTFPNQYLTVATKLTLPVGWTYPARLYWNADATLAGNDDGDQFEGVSASGQQVRGVVSPDGTEIQAFRQIQGQNLSSWAGFLDCPWIDDASCLPMTGQWVRNNLDAPNSISQDEDIDNGYGISVPVVSTAGVHRAEWELIFLDCSGLDPVECIDTKAPSQVVEEETESPDNPIEDSKTAEPRNVSGSSEALGSPDSALATTGESEAIPMVVGLAMLTTGMIVLLLSRRRTA